MSATVPGPSAAVRAIPPTTALPLTGGADDRRAVPILTALWLLVFSVSTQTMLVAPMLPRIAEQLRIPEARLGALVTGYAVAVGMTALLMGPVSDKVGRRRMMLVGSALMAVALALHAPASGYLGLLAARTLTGIGGGVLTGAAAAYVGDYFPPKRRGWANGWLASGAAVGQILGIPLGTLLAERWGFRLPFVAFAGLMALSCLLVWWVVPQPRVERMRGALTMGTLVTHYRELLGERAAVAAVLTSFGIFLGVSLHMLFLPTWLERVRGVSAAAVAGMFAVGGVVTTLVGPPVGRWSDRVGRKRLVWGASLGLAITMFATTHLVTGVWAAYALFATLSALVAARGAPLQALQADLVPDAERGSLMSLSMALGQVGSGIGGAVAAATYAAWGYGSNAALAATSVLLTAALVWRGLPETRSP